MDTNNQSEDDKVILDNLVDQLHVRDSLRMYNELVQRCFSECVDSFTSKKLRQTEADCVERCAEKFLKLSMLTGLKFSKVIQGVDTSDESP